MFGTLKGCAVSKARALHEVHTLECPRSQFSSLVVLRARAARFAGLRHDTQVGFERLPAIRELLFGLLVRDRGNDDAVAALLPVCRRSNAVLRGELQRIDHPEDLI